MRRIFIGRARAIDNIIIDSIRCDHGCFGITGGTGISGSEDLAYCRGSGNGRGSGRRRSSAVNSGSNKNFSIIRRRWILAACGSLERTRGVESTSTFFFELIDCFFFKTNDRSEI